MDERFVLNLICFFLIIPHNENSPLPKKEQDYGLLKRDMASSLIGDESFGLANQNYRKSFIRERKSVDSVLNRAPQMAGKRKNYGNKERLKQEEHYESDNNADADYKEHYKEQNYFTGSDKREPVFEEIEGDADNFQYDKYRNNKGADARYYIKYRGNGRLRNASPFRSPVRYHKGGSSSFEQDEEMMGLKGSLCGNNKNKYAPDITLGVMEVLKLEGGSNKGKPFENGEETAGLPETEENIEGGRFRIKNGLSRQELRNFIPKKRNFGKRGDSASLNLKGANRSPAMEEEYYYENELKSPGNKENDENFETEDYYDQLNDHDVLYKRDESKQQPAEARNGDRNNDESGARVDSSLKDEDNTKSLTNEKSESMAKDRAGNSDALKEQNDETVLQNADLVWKMNNNLQAKELNDVMKDSQRALEQVQLFQQKLDLKAMNNNPTGDVKFEESAPASSESKETDKGKENRAKREDEDEQKNMKTGTDEGGGGEYEDEEGKGHNDEEEYYEEIDDANDEEQEEEKDRSLKRDAGKGEHSKIKSQNEMAATDEDEDEDDELSLKNAPIENVEDQKKFNIEDDGTY